MRGLCYYFDGGVCCHPEHGSDIGEVSDDYCEKCSHYADIEEERKIAEAIGKYCQKCSAKINVSAQNCPMEKQCPLYPYRVLNEEK
jgi:predicted sulfurtransferase